MHYQYDDPPKVSNDNGNSKGIILFLSKSKANQTVNLCRKTTSLTHSSALIAQLNSRLTILRKRTRIQATCSTQIAKASWNVRGQEFTLHGNLPREAKLVKARRFLETSQQMTALLSENRTEVSANETFCVMNACNSSAYEQSSPI